MSLKINNDAANGSATLQASNTATGDVVATLPPFSTELAPRMQLMTAKTAGGTSVDFTGIPSWAKKVTVMFDGVNMTGSNSNMLIQLGTSTGIETSGYVGSYSIVSNGVGSISHSSGFANGGTSGARYGTVCINILSNSTYTIQGITSLASSFSFVVSGKKTLANILDIVRITSANGTDVFSAGTINILVEG